MTAPWGAGALHQRLNAFVKKSLIQQLVPPGAVVCDLYCGRGVDTENWGEAKIGKYVGVDLSSSALEEAKEEWERNEKPFVARFCELNPCMTDLEKHLGVERLSVDVVTCLSHLQDCFASEDMVRQLLKNVSSLLKPGGYFFGATPDSSTIWYKYQKAVEGAMKAGSLRANGHLPRVRTELYSISFEDDRFNEYGSRYQLRFADESVPPQSQILVHFPSLIRRAEELGLECVEIQNLTEFYEDYRVSFAETLQKSCGTLVDAKGHPVVDGKSRLSPVAQDVLSLYTTFIFRKPDPQQRERALKRPAVPTPAPVDVKKTKKFSPAVHLEDRPLKKQRLSASPAVATSNGSKVQEPNPKQEKSSSRPKPETVTKTEPARPSAKISKPSGESKVPKPDIASSESRGRTKTESPSVSKPKGLGAQRTESPSATKPKPSEGGQRNDLGPQELSQPSKSSDIPSSSGLLSENHRRNEGPQAQEPVKRKRVSRWSNDYVPKVISSSAAQVTSQHSVEGDMVSRVASSVREAQVVGSGGATTTKPHHDGKHNHNGFSQRESPVSKQEPREEGEVAAEDPVRSPKRERRVATGSAQRAAPSERNTDSIGSETQVNGSVVAQPQEGSTTTLEPEGKAQVKGIAASGSTQKNGSTAGNSDGKKESVNPKPRKKEIAMDVLLDRASENAATCATTVAPSETAAVKENDDARGLEPADMDFERGSKLSRDSPAGEPTSRDRRDVEPAWETKPQRYTLRRAASLSEGGVESPPPLWFSAKMDREHHPVFHPRVPYVNPMSGFGAGLRAPPSDRRVVPPLPGGAGLLGAGLLGAAPSPIFGDRGLPGDRRFDMMGPPEGGRGFSDLRVPRPNIRGSLYKNDRVLPRGANSDFAGEGPHIPSVSNGAPWDDHFQGDGRSRINR